MQRGGLPHRGSSRFPENRENNREFVVFSTIWALGDAKSRSNSKALACNSLFNRIREFSPHEQGMNPSEQGIPPLRTSKPQPLRMPCRNGETPSCMIYPITIVRFFQERRCISAVRPGTAPLGEDAGIEEPTLERVPIKLNHLFLSHGRACRGHPRLSCGIPANKGVDSRDKARP